MNDPSRHANGALHEQREWLRVTLASIGDAVITTDVDSRVTFLNPVAEDLTGWSQDDAAGQPLEAVFKIVNKETRQTVESPSVRALREGVIVGLANHTLLIAKDGTERPIDDSAAPIRKVNEEIGRDEIAGVVLVFRDITERYRQEQTIQDALSYAENIIATLREPFLVLDDDLRVVSANRSFYENFQVTREKTQGQLVYELGNGQWDIPGLRSVLSEVLSNQHPVVDYEVKHDFPTIGRRIMLLNAVRIRKPGNHSNLILLAIGDVTERKLAELAVEISEVRYRRLFEAARDGILILDANTLKITDANPYMSELLGATREEFLGKELWEFGFFGDKRESQAVYRDLQQRGYVRYDHLPLETKSGKSAEVEFISNVYQVDGRVVAQCNIRDVSDRRRLERKTQKQAADLADLHRRKDEFLAMLGHELRNPLAPIANAVHLLRLQENEDELQKEARDVIERQVAQMTRLIDDLLEVSRISTGRIHLHQDRVTLGGIVEHAVETVRPLIDQRRHALNLSLPPAPIWLYADAARLEQVVVNLLTNAAKYTEAGGKISLTVEQEGDEAELRVRDTGEGIAPELLPRIFDLFTQSERSLDRSQGGLGIGLSLVQKLVEMHRGRVDAYSALGKGSEFVVRLPILLTPEPSSPAAQEKPMSEGALRILVVDDMRDTSHMLSILLKKEGHDVRTAADGPGGLAAAIEFRPHVALLDIGLPGMDGHEVAQRIRQEPQIAGIVLIAMTGYGQESDRQRTREAGFDHHLVKPADIRQVLPILATVGENAASEESSSEKDG